MPSPSRRACPGSGTAPRRSSADEARAASGRSDDPVPPCGSRAGCGSASSVSVTLPRLTRTSSSARARPTRRTRKPANRNRPDDAARRADDDHDADPHPNGHPGRAPRPRREEDQRVVVARLDAPRQPRRDGEPPGRAGPKDEAPRQDGEPGRRRPRTSARATTRGRPRRSSENPARHDVDDDRASDRDS